MSDNAKLLFLCGKMAAGKSTLSRELAERENAVLLVQDEFLERLFPGEIVDIPGYVKYSSRLNDALEPLICSLLSRGISVVLDFPGNTRSQRAWFRHLLEVSGADHELHFIDVSDDVCKRQLNERSNGLPAGTAWTTDAEFDAITAYFEPPSTEERFNWDRSPKWSQFRSGSRQRGGLPDSVRCDRRAHPHHSARGETRGESSGSGWSVFELGVDGPARRWTLLSPAFWSGPPPIPRHGPPRATNRMTRPPRRSLPQEAARGFWIRAWGQREPALQGTGRFNRPAPRLGALKGGLDIPATHVGYRSLRIESPNRTLTRRVCTRAEQAGMPLPFT
jgi:predicted kinase